MSSSRPHALPNESDHRHASGWIESRHARRHARARRCRGDLSAPRQAALAGIVDGKLVDLSYPLEKDAAVRIVTDRSPEALALYRHSTAHLLAAAVTNLFPGVQCGIGPATDEGFFYDFVVAASVRARGSRRDRAEDAGARRRRIWSTSARCGRAKRRRRSSPKRGEPLKVQLIDEKTEGQREVSCYTIKDKETFIDFCVGPHVPSTGRLKAFKLLTTSNAYWKGDARNQPMQRDLRHRLPLGQGAQGAPHADRRGEEARPPQAGTRARPVHVPPVGAGRGVLARQGHDALQHARELHARRAASRPATSR